jgi:hypothetical protein
VKTLANPRDREALVRRLRSVRPDSNPKWGRMSAHEMICHLADAFRMATGTKPVSEASGLLHRTLLKWFVLYVPLAWPAGIPTRPELDQTLGGTKPLDFVRDVLEVESLLGQFAAPHAIDCPAHPIFGPMSQSAWHRWAYLHTDHHLRQFGA